MKLSAGYTQKWHDEHQVPYAYGEEGWMNPWVGYDDVRSFKSKVCGREFEQVLDSQGAYTNIPKSLNSLSSKS